MADEDPKSPPPTDPPSKNPVLEGYYAATLAEAQALRPEELNELNIDIMASVITVTGCQKKLTPFRDEIASKLGTAINMTYIDEMPRYIGAVTQANRMYAVASESVAPLVAMAAELGTTHELLYGDAESFARHGLIDGSKLPSLKNHNGYQQLSTNVLNLAQLLKDNWSKIEGKTALTKATITDAEQAALALIDAAGDKQQRIAAATEAANLRVRFFTLFYRMWQEWRRAMKFLRWSEGDEELYAPSLWLGRSVSSSKKTKSDGKPGDADTEPKADADKDNGLVPPATPPAAQNGHAAPANGGVIVEQRFDR